MAAKPSDITDVKMSADALSRAQVTPRFDAERKRSVDAIVVHTSTQQTERKDGVDIGKVLQHCHALCVNRKKINEELLQWVKDPSTTLNELQTYWKTKHSTKKMNNTIIRAKLVTHLTNTISYYNQIISALEQEITENIIDGVFLHLDRMLRVRIATTGENPAIRPVRKSRNPKYQSEFFYYWQLLHKLKTIVGPETQESLQYYTLYPLELNRAQLDKSLVTKPFEVFNMALKKIKTKQEEWALSKETRTLLYSTILNSLVITEKFTKSQAGYQDASELVHKIREAIRTDEVKKLIKDIKQAMQPMKTHTQELLILFEKITEFKKISENLFLAELDGPKAMLNELLKELSKNCLTEEEYTLPEGFSQSMRNLTTLIRRGSEMIVSLHKAVTQPNAIENIQALIEELQAMQELKEELVQTIKNYTRDFKDYCQQAAQSKQQDTAQNQAAAASQTAAPAEPKKVKRPPPVPAVLNRTEGDWKQLVEQRRAALEAERLVRKRAQAETERKAALDRKEAAEKNYALEAVDLKLREDRIRSSLRRNPTIRGLFAKLYSPKNDFGHEDLQALIHALQNQGFNIQAPCRDSHYVVIIEGTYGEMNEDEFALKAGAVRAHNTDRDCFMLETLRNLRTLFIQAGFTEAVVLETEAPKPSEGSKPASA